MGYNHDYPVHKIGSQNSAFRYHPYQQQHYERNNQSQVTSSSPAYPPQPTPSPSPKQCDKCGYVCESATQLIEHLNVAHPPTPAPHPMSSYQNFMFGNTEIKVEDDAQSEILDLDSHKVHQVYSEEEKRQQQNGELSHNPHSVSAMLNQWPHPGTAQQQQNQQNSPQQQKMYVQDHQRMYGMPEQKMYPNGMQEKMFQEKLFSSHQVPNEFMQNGVTTTSQENAMTQPPQAYRPFEMAPQAAPPVITSTQVPVGPPQTAPPPSTKSTNWKSNEARRPKTYNCTACNKWFTSSGHLKRHYNTTLHKNAVKSSGQPDPASLPISAHHHPARDQNNREDQTSNSPNDEPKEDPLALPFERPPSIPGLLQQPPNGPYDRQPAPNIHHPSIGHGGSRICLAVPKRGSRPLSYRQYGFEGSAIAQHYPPSHEQQQPAWFYPAANDANGEQPVPDVPKRGCPHVTQVTINNLNITGEDAILPHQYSTVTTSQPLPSFAQFQAHRYGLVLSYNGANANVGARDR
ncbi:zinc-finger double-stranded rna-binding [Holotrichia oblita]|uniref:Zinc-finger double-stranded rna-binding n=1 Tax=Holotrichia oblita TaxID=644536 RepID=A0ACB9TBU4_HOLOL|nr:zinc-finger double-stranded rna-binding [Holotrichia oblita]